MKRDEKGKRQDPLKKYIRRPNGSMRVSTFSNLPSRTQQQHKEECDVNNIIAKYRKTGTITHIRNRTDGVYADLTALPIDLQEAQHLVLKAEAAFAEIPAKLRQRFNHDPNEMIAFLSDPKNDEESIKLGLKTRPLSPKPDPILNELKNLNQNLKPKPKPKNTDPE